MSPFAKLAAAVSLVAALPSTALAHHGWSTYDESKPVTVSGSLTDVAWGNPHGSAKMRWRDREWTVILAPVSRMTARGLTKEEIDKGQRVTVTGYARRDGTAEMRLERIKIGDKTVELR